MPSLNTTVTPDRPVLEMGALPPRQAGVHHCLDGIGNELFHFLGGQPWRLGIDRHLDVGDIRKGIQIQRGNDESGAGHRCHKRNHHQQPVGDRPIMIRFNMGSPSA